MKALKIWAWLLLAAAAALFAYGWLSGEFSGHGIADMDNAALLLSVFSAVCALLAITVFLIAWAVEHSKSDK